MTPSASQSAPLCFFIATALSPPTRSLVVVLVAPILIVGCHVARLPTSASQPAPPPLLAPLHLLVVWVALLGPSIHWLSPMASLSLPSHTPLPLGGRSSRRLSSRAVATKADTKISTCHHHSNPTVIHPPAGEWMSLMAAAAVLPTHQGCHHRRRCHPSHHRHQCLANTVTCCTTCHHPPSRHNCC